jgi:hypothetical protein
VVLPTLHAFAVATQSTMCLAVCLLHARSRISLVCRLSFRILCQLTGITATTQFAVQLCKLQNVNVNTQPSCPSGSATLSSGATPSAGNSTVAPATGSASMTASGSASHSSGSASHTSALVAGSTGAASYQSAGAGVGLGIAMFGLLAAL